MKPELQEKAVLAMYDVRGIQSYIFKSNAAKEIIGASVIVANVIMDGLNAYVRKNIAEAVKENYMTDWENDNEHAFLENREIQMQVLFIGGGNAYVLFRNGAECEKVNRFLAKYIMEQTYSLNLAVAVVEKTDSYNFDYEAINKEMRRVKANMPSSQPIGAMPFMEADPITGYPITKVEKGKYFCTEAVLKRNAFPKQESEKVFDNMVTEKGDNSTLAVCHIDGNSMGDSIRHIMQKINGYENAVPAMRNISKEIADTFRNNFDKMAKYMDELTPQVKMADGKKLYREIIVAGDDITFVCNAKLAVPAVRYFLEHIGDEKDYSACGGIAFFNSHFPFSDAYKVAEACCVSAKTRAKEESHRGKVEENTGKGKIGNFFDFQFCTNISAAHLEAYREKHYAVNGQLFLARPYYVPLREDRAELNIRNREFSVEKFTEWSEVFQSLPRNKAKLLRNAISKGENSREETVTFLKSRGYTQFEKEEYAVWYDVLEMMDLYIGEGKEHEN